MASGALSASGTSNAQTTAAEVGGDIRMDGGVQVQGISVAPGSELILHSLLAGSERPSPSMHGLLEDATKGKDSEAEKKNKRRTNLREMVSNTSSAVPTPPTNPGKYELTRPPPEW